MSDKNPLDMTEEELFTAEFEHAYFCDKLGDLSIYMQCEQLLFELGDPEYFEDDRPGGKPTRMDLIELEELLYRFGVEKGFREPVAPDDRKALKDLVDTSSETKMETESP